MAIYDKKSGWFGGVLLVLAALALAALWPIPSRADLVSADKLNAIQGWYGTDPIQFAESNGNNVDGSIDYAVYAPGQFDLSFPGEDPSHGTQYVYRYQLYDSSSPTSTDSIRKLSVGLVGVTDAANCQYVNTGPLYAGDGVAPTFQVGLIGAPPTSAVWAFKSSALLDPGQHSEMLIFTSPYGPTWAPATVLAPSSSNWWQGELPSPVPEPATLVGLLTAGLMFVAYRSLRRKKS